MAVCTGTASYLAVNRQANAASAPSSPTNVSLSAGNASITVSWHSPISLGGGSLANYIIEHRALGAGSWTTNNAAPTATSHTISGLTNDHKYQVRIAAKTASGTSPYAPILLAIPHAAPTISHVDPAADITPGQTITIQGSGFLPKGKTIVQVASSTVASLALTSDGVVYGWGVGPLGDGTTNNSNVPVAVKTAGTPMDGKKIVQVESGSLSRYAIASDGTVYAWGYNDHGQLGDGTNTNSNVPVAVKTTGTPMEGKRIVQISSCSSRVFAIASDGTVYGWGEGQLGDGTTNDSNVPVAVKTTGTPMDGKKIVQVATHLYNAIALASDGTVYGWGNNADGELGNGMSFNGSNVPVAVKTTGTPMDGKTIVQITGSNSYSLASDGTVYGWGNNQHGQLGNGTTTSSLVPVVAATSNSALAPSTPKVTIGGVPATDVTIVDSNTITVKVPAHPGGSADITIDLGDGDPLYKVTKTNALHYKVAPATPGSGGAGSANGGNGQRYRGSRPGGTLANTGDNLTILLFTAGILIAGALTLIIGVRLRKDWQV